MGLSARYGPQFTLQHVPDYRQNVYIPGSTATLTANQQQQQQQHQQQLQLQQQLQQQQLMQQVLPSPQTPGTQEEPSKAAGTPASKKKTAKKDKK